MQDLAKAALMIGGVKDPAASQVEILTKIMTVFVAQQVKGLEKYDQAVNPLDDYDWLEMKLEEQVDGAIYQICELVKVKSKRDEIQWKRMQGRLAQMIGDGSITFEEIQKALGKKGLQEDE